VGFRKLSELGKIRGHGWFRLYGLCFAGQFQPLVTFLFTTSLTNRWFIKYPVAEHQAGTDALLAEVSNSKRGEVMARVIPFYVPDVFKPKAKWVPASERKVIIFPSSATKRTA